MQIWIPDIQRDKMLLLSPIHSKVFCHEKDLNVYQHDKKYIKQQKNDDSRSIFWLSFGLSST